MKANGIKILQSGVTTTKGSAITRYIYLDTIKQCGIISEFVASKSSRCRIAFISNIGCITGDVERVKV